LSTGGMLALLGDADDSLTQFLELIEGTDAINYWDDSASGWAPITGATPRVDYTLAYINTTGSALCGYTLLRVGTSSTVPGDANVDGVVDENDARALASNWGQPGGWRQGDFNHDFLVGPADAAILAANWGYETEQGGQSTGVPEPGSVTLFLWLAVGVLLSTLRRR